MRKERLGDLKETRITVWLRRMGRIMDEKAVPRLETPVATPPPMLANCGTSGNRINNELKGMGRYPMHTHLLHSPGEVSYIIETSL